MGYKKSQQLTTQQAISRAKKAYKHGKIADAVELYTAILAHQPNHPVAKKALHKLQKGLPQNLSVETETSSPSQDQIDSLANLYQSGQMTKTEAACRDLLQKYPQSLIIMNVLGGALVGQGKLKESIHEFDKAIQLKPDFSEAYNNRGIVLERLGQLDGAVESYGKAIQLKPDHPDAYNNRGNALKDLGQTIDAMQDYNKAIQLKPDFAVAYNNRGTAFKVLGKLEEALKDYDKAIQLKPDYPVALNNKGVALQDLGRRDEPIQNYDKAIQLKPDFAVAYNNRGTAFKVLGQLEEALKDYDKAIQLLPDYPVAFNNRGIVYFELGQLDEAMQNYDKAIQLKPDYAEAQYNCHSLLLNPDNLMPAIKCMEKAIDIDPLNMHYRFILGMLWDYSGDTQKASTAFEIVERGDTLYRARLDAWRYIKSVDKKVPTIIESKIHAFKLGIEAAVVDGLVLEFGVRFGTSIRQISTLVDQDVYGFDSFQGLPESWHSEAKGSYSTKGVIPSVPQNVILHDGWFEETLPGFVQQHPEPVRFMNIDCDIYSSTKTILETFAKQIIPGTVLVFDEYIGNEHWREDEFKAFQEAVLKYGWDYEYLGFSFVTKQVVVRIN